MHSFGIPVAAMMRGKNSAEAAEQLRDTLSGAQTKFLASLKTSLTIGRYFLCHAGIVRAFLWNARARRICYGSVMSFSKARWISARSSFMATDRPSGTENLSQSDQYRYWRICNWTIDLRCVGKRRAPIYDCVTVTRSYCLNAIKSHRSSVMFFIFSKILGLLRCRLICLS